MNELSKYLTEQILLEETTELTNFVVVYSGRFQPFHKGHYATYQNLVKKFGRDRVYIGTSNKTDNQKSPFNFKEKKIIMTKMFGIPSNKIVEIKNPYAPIEILKKYDENTTGYITVVGEKDASRLGGKYFEKYTGKIEQGYKDKGYVYISPAQSNAVSGTDVRNWLSRGDETELKAGFLKAYPKFDEKIFKLITLKLSKLNENMPGGVGIGLSFPNGTINGAPKPEDVKKMRKKLDAEDDDLTEEIKLDVNIGDTVLMGKFKNKKTVVKSIGKDEHGMPTINGKKVATFRILPKVNIFKETNLAEEIANEYSHLLDLYEASSEDEKYVHLGYGKYKEKGKEKDQNAPTFEKDDSGKYTQIKSNNNTTPAKPKGAEIKGAEMFKHDPNVKQPATQPKKDWTVGKDGWEIIDDDRAKVKKIRKYTDEELQGETGEYFNNKTTKKVAPNAFKDESEMIQKMKDAKPVFLSSEEMQNMGNTDVGDILSASEDGGKDAMIKLGRERASKYGKDWDRLEKGIAKGNAVPPPIALRDANGKLHLVAGNTRLMSFTASGKKLPVKVIDYDGEFNYDDKKDSQSNEPKRSITKNIERKISGWAEKEKEFFKKGQDQPNSKTRRTIGEALRDKAKGAGKAIAHGFKHEVHLFKEAAGAVKKFSTGEELSDSDKKALKDVAIKVVTTAVGAAAMGGLAGGAIAFAKLVAIELVPHVVIETLAVGAGKAAIFADTNEDERLLMGFMEKITEGLESMEIPDEVMEKIVDKYNETKSVNEIAVYAGTLSGGLSQNKKLSDFVKKYNTTIDIVKEKIKEGARVEMEHTDDVNIAVEIAKDHLWEDLEYYTKLASIETHESRIPQNFNTAASDYHSIAPIKNRKYDKANFRTKDSGQPDVEDEGGQEIDEVGIGTGQSGIRPDYPKNDKLSDRMKSVSKARTHTNSDEEYQYNPVYEMAKSELDAVEQYADNQLSPEDIELGKETDHFFQRLNDPRNGKPISPAELTGFFKRLAKNKKKFLDFIKQYNEFVVKDTKSNINIAFMKAANKLIAKTVMRKSDFKTTSPIFKTEVISTTKNETYRITSKNHKTDSKIERDFIQHHKSSSYAPDMGYDAELDTIDFDDDRKKLPGHQMDTKDDQNKGYEPVREGLKDLQKELISLYGKAFKMMPKSPAQMKVRAEIDKLRKEIDKLKTESINESAVDIVNIFIMIAQMTFVGVSIKTALDDKGIGPIDAIKKWWNEIKTDRAIKSISNKIKTDPDIIEFLKLSPSQQRGKFRALVASKLSGDELAYLNKINKSNLS
jgi:hypothetical protein